MVGVGVLLSSPSAAPAPTTSPDVQLLSNESLFISQGPVTGDPWWWGLQRDRLGGSAAGNPTNNALANAVASTCGLICNGATGPA
ncbi:hypothetical protein C6A85_99670, partial [Mycobacterium sp. ITM-2017-0098]